MTTHTQTQPEEQIGASRAYWAHNVGKPTGPVAQFRMSQLIDFDLRLKDPDRTVYRFMLGWYHEGHGDALASVRHIVTTMRARAPNGARHLSRSAVQRAIIKLIETGWMVRSSVGKGKSASRFVPVINVLELASQGTLPSLETLSVPEKWDARNDDASVPESWDSSVPEKRDTKPDSVPEKWDKDSTTDSRTDAKTVSRETNAHGIAQLGPVGAAALPRVPKEGFDELYQAYGLRRKRAEARAAYDKIKPDADLQARMLSAAGIWHSSYEANGTDIKWRKLLHSWLAKECWEEDPPVAYVDAKEAAIAKAANSTKSPAKPANSNRPPDGINDAYIVGITQVNDFQHHDYKLTLELQYADSGQFFDYPMEVTIITGPGADREAYYELCAALEGYKLLDMSQAMGLPVKTATRKGKLGFGKSFLDARDITEEVEIVKSKVFHDEGEEFLEVIMKTPNGMDLEWYATYESPSQEEKLAGRQEIAKLLNAVGIAGVEDESELVGRTLSVCRKVRSVVGLLPYSYHEQQVAA